MAIDTINFIDLLTDIHTLTKELTAFEHKYNLLSEVFYQWYCQGHEPDDDTWLTDLSEWAGLYRSRQYLTEQYHHMLRQQLTANQETITSHLHKQVRLTNV